MRRALAGLGLLLSPFCAAFGQTPAAAGFEVASIKPSDPLAKGTSIGIRPGGLFTTRNVTLQMLIQFAYDARDFQVSGGPGWINSERYDITAKTGDPDEADPNKMTDQQRQVFQDQLRLRLKALLADRFQLKVHMETKDLPVYALIVSKNGPKLQLTTETSNNGGIRAGLGEITGHNVPLTDFARVLSDRVGRPVLDKTALKGKYDFKLTFAPEPGQIPSGKGDGAPEGPSFDPDGPSLFTAVQEQLGLKLDSQKGPVAIVVIDSAEKASEN